MFRHQNVLGTAFKLKIMPEREFPSKYFKKPDAIKDF